MFSTEQKFEVSGDMTQLEEAVKFAINMFDIGKSNICFQITDDGKYCLGWGMQEGWTLFPFDFDAHIIAKIVEQHLSKQVYNEDDYAFYDGCTGDGFLMKVIPCTFADTYNGIKNPFYGIVSIEPFVNYYAK